MPFQKKKFIRSLLFKSKSMKVFWIKASGKTTAIPWFTWRFRDDISNIFIKWSNLIEKLSNSPFL